MLWKDEIAKREKECRELRDMFDKEIENLKNDLKSEKTERQNERDQLQNQIDKLTSDLGSANDDLLARIEKEEADRIAEAKKLGDFFR